MFFLFVADWFQYQRAENLWKGFRWRKCSPKMQNNQQKHRVYLFIY